MSNPKLNIKEETSTKKTRSPPKKTKVEPRILLLFSIFFPPNVELTQRFFAAFIYRSISLLMNNEKNFCKRNFQRAFGKIL